MGKPPQHGTRLARCKTAFTTPGHIGAVLYGSVTSAWVKVRAPPELMGCSSAGLAMGLALWALPLRPRSRSELQLTCSGRSPLHHQAACSEAMVVDLHGASVAPSNSPPHRPCTWMAASSRGDASSREQPAARGEACCVRTHNYHRFQDVIRPLGLLST